MSNQLGASGYLTVKPGLLSTASDTGCLQGLVGISSAMINTWPFMLVSRSSVHTDIGKGDFQELDQMGM
jgi:thiamine pyrophosphate-dependent acetolactate synthase large subunit-like protein